MYVENIFVKILTH